MAPSRSRGAHGSQCNECVQLGNLFNHSFVAVEQSLSRIDGTVINFFITFLLSFQNYESELHTLLCQLGSLHFFKKKRKGNLKWAQEGSLYSRVKSSCSRYLPNPGQRPLEEKQPIHVSD